MRPVDIRPCRIKDTHTEYIDGWQKDTMLIESQCPECEELWERWEHWGVPFGCLVLTLCPNCDTGIIYMTQKISDW